MIFNEIDNKEILSLIVPSSQIVVVVELGSLY